MTNYSGKIANMEVYTINTDSSAFGTITTVNTPFEDAGILLWTNATARTAEFVSRSGNIITVRIRKLNYEKAFKTNCDANNLPSGVSSASSKFQTDQNTSWSGAVAGGPAAYCYHTHGVSFQYTHSHTITSYAETDCLLATNENNINIVVIYTY